MTAENSQNVLQTDPKFLKHPDVMKYLMPSPSNKTLNRYLPKGNYTLLTLHAGLQYWGKKSLSCGQKL